MFLCKNLKLNITSRTNLGLGWDFSEDFKMRFISTFSLVGVGTSCGIDSALEDSCTMALFRRNCCRFRIDVNGSCSFCCRNIPRTPLDQHTSCLSNLFADSCRSYSSCNRFLCRKSHSRSFGTDVGRIVNSGLTF